MPESIATTPDETPQVTVFYDQFFPVDRPWSVNVQLLPNLYPCLTSGSDFFPKDPNFASNGIIDYTKISTDECYKWGSLGRPGSLHVVDIEERFVSTGIILQDRSSITGPSFSIPSPPPNWRPMQFDERVSPYNLRADDVVYTKTILSSVRSGSSKINPGDGSSTFSGKVLLYDMIPASFNVFNFCLFPDDSEYFITQSALWRKSNDFHNRAGGLIDSLDGFAPSFYTVSDNISAWKKWVSKVVEECSRLRSNYPVCAFVNPCYHPSAGQGLANLPLPLNIWQEQLTYLRDVIKINGVVAWKGNDTPIQFYGSGSSGLFLHAQILSQVAAGVSFGSSGSSGANRPIAPRISVPSVGSDPSVSSSVPDVTKASNWTNNKKAESWMELTGVDISGTIFKGSVSTTVTTVIGKKYFVFFDISNSADAYLQGSSVTKKVKVTAGPSSSTFSTLSTATESKPLLWKNRSFSFIANSTNTIIKLENASDQFGDVRDILYGPQIDNILVVAEEDLNDEFGSSTTAENLDIDQPEFELNYSLNATDDFSQIPITMSLVNQSKNADLYIDDMDKQHIVYQSNRNDFWDIYYTGARRREDLFMFDIRITQSESDSINSSIAVDKKGRRLITWQDNRTGIYQIYGAVSKSVDEQFIDSCKQDEVDEFIYQWNNSLDPFYDPYLAPISQLNCAVEFTFNSPYADLFHFNLLFYEDKEYTVPYKTITSKTNISGWRVNNKQFSYNGLDAKEGVEYDISYIPSYRDELSGKVLYVVVEYEINSICVDFRNSKNLKMLQPYSGLNLNISRVEDSNYRAMLEFDDLSPISVSPQTVESLNQGLFTGMTFDSPLTELPGFSVGDKIKSVLLHFDPIGVSGSVTSIIKFTSPVVALFISGNDVIESNSSFGYPGITYPTSTVVGLESFDKVKISADRKTITINSIVDPAMDEIRVILKDNASVIGQNQFVYYCPEEQSIRCDVKCEFVNNFTIDKNIHFRITFYANVEKTDVIMSSFTKFDTLNWLSGSSSFPENGLSVSPGQTVNAVYSPEIIPFELFESQTITTFSDKIIRQPLLCGVPYHVVIESYRDGVFYVESELEFICPCNKTDSDLWNKETDSLSWICSGQGFEDFRISLTDNECLYPKLFVNNFDFFYITWQDFRYSGIQDNQPYISPDCFMGMYDASLDKFICSGQGGYDRRLTNFSSNKLVLYDYSIFVDPFQNINMVMHDGNKFYSQSCSLGCKLTSINKDLILPCMFTDNTDPSFFVVGGLPDRTVDQYQKIRISEKYVAFSTYVDLSKPMAVVNDCFIEFNIIGVPGTYAYRLRNENDQDWSDWLPIGPDLPVQSQTDTGETKKERDFFRAYFTQRDVFVAPWVISPGNGTKRVCCEILTFFGKTETFCIDFMALYDDLEYKIDLFFDETFTKPVSKYKNYMIVSEFKTETIINDTNLTSIKEDLTSVSSIFVKIEFKNKDKIKLIEKIQSIQRFNYLDKITMSVYQQGINDQLDLPLSKAGEGIYTGSFSVKADDGVLNVDGLGIIVVDVPGQCKPVSFGDLSQRAANFEINRTLDQNVTVFNNFTVFRDKYNGDDIKGSFGNPDYYKVKKFGLSSVSDSKNPWIGSGPGVSGG